MGKLCMNSDLDSEHLGIGNAPPPQKKVVCSFMLEAWFLKLFY